MLRQFVDERLVKILPADHQRIDADGVNRLSDAWVKVWWNDRELQKRVVAAQGIDWRTLDRDELGAAGNGASQGVRLVARVVEHRVEGTVQETARSLRKGE